MADSSRHWLAARLETIAPSATTEMFRRVAELRAQGVPVISLAVGEPDFDPPAQIVAAAQRALERGPYGYTQVPGLPQLREAICARSHARRGIVHAPEQVVVTAGAKHALFEIAEALFDPGDEVLIPTPSWVSYADQVRLCGATPVFIACSADDGFLPRPEMIAAAITPKTKALILCSPNNPTGASFTKLQLEQLANVLRGTGLWVIVDEIYAELYYDGECAPSLLSVAPDLAEQTVIVDGVSKSYAMTGFRVGWMLAPRALASACTMLQSQVTTSIATVAQLAAIAALSGDQACVRTMREAYRGRRERTLKGLSALPGVRCNEPSGAFYVFADVRAWLGKRGLNSDVDVAEWLLDSARVACVPGSAFGTAGYLRVSYATSEQDIDAALQRMAATVAELV
jgi:aspartate aminotransferase